VAGAAALLIVGGGIYSVSSLATPPKKLPDADTRLEQLEERMSSAELQLGVVRQVQESLDHLGKRVDMVSRVVTDLEGRSTTVEKQIIIRRPVVNVMPKSTTVEKLPVTQGRGWYQNER